MNIIHILGIAILFSTYSATEDTKIKQRTLLRKLLSNQIDESTPMWNAVLADVLVNKIRIFSFKKQHTETESITEIAQEKSPLTNFISQVFFLYKKFVYDVFAGPSEPPANNNSVEPHAPEIEDRKDPNDIFKDYNVTFSDGPKSEVEILEPRYHGKQVLRNGTDDGDGEGQSDEISESVKECPEGTVKVKGDCVSRSRLIMMIPNQCPIGYKRDRLGYCRMIF